MISLTGELNLACSRSAFWNLPETDFFSDFYQPAYYIGQTVLHRMKVEGGEILHPVKVMGIRWTGMDWEYEVLFPPDHPECQEDITGELLEDWQIEQI